MKPKRKSRGDNDLEKSKVAKRKRNHHLRILTPAELASVERAEYELCMDDLDITCRISAQAYRDMLLSPNLTENQIYKYYYGNQYE